MFLCLWEEPIEIHWSRVDASSEGWDQVDTRWFRVHKRETNYRSQSRKWEWIKKKKHQNITRIENAVTRHNLLRRQRLNVGYSSFQVSVDDDILWGFWFLRHCCLHHVSTDSWLDWFGVNFKHRNILQIIEKLKSIIWVRTLANRCLQLYLKVYFMFDVKVNLCIGVPSKQCRQ